VTKSSQVCYLTFDSLSEGVGQSQIVPLVMGLAKTGCRVKVISFEKRNNPELASELLDAGIDWISLPFGKPGIRGIPKRIFLMAINVPKADVYHCRSDLPVLVMALRRKRPFLWDVRSLWYEQKLIIDNKSKSSFIAFVLKKLECYAAKNASAVNVLAEPLLEVLEERNGVIPTIRTVIPTSVDLEKFKLQSSFQDQRMILLSGTLNNFYDIDTSIKILKEFYIQGFSIQWARGHESKRHILGESFIRTLVLSHKEMPKKIAASSFGIAICRTDCVDVLKGVMPTKVAEFLAMGRPVIVSRGMGDLDSLITQSRTGIVIKSGMSEKEIVSKSKELLLDTELSQRCRKLAESHFSMAQATLKYKVVYEEIMKAKYHVAGPY
jgi:glycosyltransferase involved in cell wall biosynthesis